MKTKAAVIILIVIGVGLLFFANIFRDKPKNNPTPSPTSEQTQSAPSLSPSPAPSVTPSVSRVSKAATCQLAGEIKFVSPNIYQTIGAQITYQNIDDKIRQIFWRSSPNDGVLTIGPNLFEELKIPNGEAEVGVDIRKAANVKVYTLTARINYGQRDAAGVTRVKETSCTGSVKVTMPS